MKSAALVFLVLALGLFLLVACDGGGDTTDAGPDAAVKDGGADVADATKDATLDVAPDAPADAPPDANLGPTSLQIQAVKAAAGASSDGGIASLPIDDATVTYVKALVGNDPAGFFVQAEQTGPAIFVAVDPQTLSPAPAPGDQVSFTVTGATVVNGLHEVTALTAFSRTAQGIPLAPLLRDVSSASDLVTNVDAYESEYVTLGATVKSSFSAAGSGFVQAQIDTTAITGNASLNLRLRAPQPVKTAIGVDVSCTVSLTGILSRFGGVAQPSGWVSGDFTNVVCSPPKVKSAVATADTAVLVTFDRDIDGATLAADASQFTFDNGLLAGAASLAASNQVSLTTSAQAANATYTVTVASSLADVLGKGVDANASHASFSSFSTVATLQINEVNPNITSSLDLVELLALTPGNVAGITLEQNISGAVVLATLPTLTVAQGDWIVVHLGATTATTESTSKTDCADASCYPGAWDVVGGTTGVTYSGRVLVVRSPSGTIQDGAAFYTGTPPGGFSTDVMSLQTAGQWLPADCGGNPCNSNALAETISVVWTGCGTSATGSSVARKANADTNYATDWAVGTSSFGASNP